MCWMVEHAADVLSKYEVSADGRTAYERMKGKACHQELVEFGGEDPLQIPEGLAPSRRKDGREMG